jgi:AcrR family transcriptional regulator
MRKGEQTHHSIIEQAADVFNRQGYAGTSIGDLMDATGLSKGAIYNHFTNKDDLALQVFDYAVGQIQVRVADAIRAAPRHAIHRLVAVVEVYRNYLDDPVFAAGCPVLNTSVEADDTHPALRARAQVVMDIWFDFLIYSVERGIQEGQVRADADAEQVAALIIAALEGGVMVSKLYADSSHLNHVVDHLVDYIQTNLAV